MKPKLLQHLALPPALENGLATRYDVHPLWKEADPKAFLAARGAEFVGYVTTARFGVDEATVAALPALKIISSFGVGTDALPLATARERGIAVGYTPEVLNDCVADTAFGLLIDVARRFSAADRFVRRGDWLKGQFPLTTRVSGKRLGILGLGRIGQTIARRASGFDMEVRYHNRRARNDVPYGYEASLLELARWADFLVVASAGDMSNAKLVSREVIEALGPQGFLINISRGHVIDEAALLDALQNGRLAGAGLDVFEREPQMDPAFWALDNAVLLPHVASATNETRNDMAALVVENLHSFFDTGKVKNSAI